MKKPAPNNRTIRLSESDIKSLKTSLRTLDKKVKLSDIKNKIINQNIFDVVNLLPSSFVDLLFLDPPYNLSKNYNGNKFHKKSHNGYYQWVESWLLPMKRLLKPNASIYICGDWRTASILQKICDDNFILMNRITFEREKGRGSTKGWKNNTEDIWFCVNSDKYYFNPEAVKLKRRVLAPYTENGDPKDWSFEGSEKYRLTYPSNMWTDITLPFWSMPENTPHPTQKPEKLLAKIILASSRLNDTVFDPFGGVGTSAVVAKKLGRNFVLIELDEEYCLYAQKRIALADIDKSIQGYHNGVFWERNSQNIRRVNYDGRRKHIKSIPKKY